MVMMKRVLIGMSIAVAALFAAAIMLLGSPLLSRALNLILPAQWQATVSAPSLFWAGQDIAQFDLDYQGCRLLRVRESRLDLRAMRWQLDKVELDYRCFSLFGGDTPEQAPTSPKKIAALLGFIPNGTFQIRQFQFLNAPFAELALLSPLFEAFTLQLEKKADDLSAYIQNSALRSDFSLSRDAFHGELYYQAQGDFQQHFTFSGATPTDFASLPDTLQATYHWQLPSAMIEDPALQRGQLSLTWQTAEDQTSGLLQAQFPQVPENRLHLPFQTDFKRLSVQQGEFYWALLPEFPLKGFINATLVPHAAEQGGILPLSSDVRISLLSENEMGKGNIVISNQGGEWQADSFSLPLQLTGNIKHGNFILYSSLPLQIEGEYDNPVMRFLPKSLLRVTGSERFLTIRDLRFPLAGIRVDKNGVRGRLQANFKGESPDFKNINLHWDGFAQAFHLGLNEVFSAEGEDQWRWRFWGEAFSVGADTDLSINGRGDWHADLIQLSELNGKLAKMVQYGMSVPSTVIRLAKPIRFAYRSEQLDGALALNTETAKLHYGAELPPIRAQLALSGRLGNLNLKGEIQAGEIGPIRLFARRELAKNAEFSRLIGRLYWQSQPISVFMPLLPFRQNWLVTDGSVQGQTDFTLSAEEGIQAGGHFSIRHGALSLPSGEISGINFALPYRLQNNLLQFGAKQPLSVSIEKLQFGQLAISEARLKVSGYYPYSRQKPLNLRELQFKLLGGDVAVARFSLPQRRKAELRLRGIELEQILALAQYHQLDLRGKVSATLPFWLEGNPCYICGGRFHQQGTSQLKFSPELIQAMKKSGYTEQILMYLMNDSRIDVLNGTIDVAKNGQMTLKSALKTSLNSQQSAKINLNYSHLENLFELWQLINYSSQFEQNIENQLYRKLEREP